MGLLDGIEKLITEHGSAAILKERIALANDQYSALQSKLHESEERVRQLEARNQSLQEQLAKIQLRFDAADRQLKGQTQERLPEERERVLKVVCFHPDLDDRQIAGIAQVAEQMTTWHLESLMALRYVSMIQTAATAWGGESRTEWSVMPKGRDYLALNGLLT